MPAAIFSFTTKNHAHKTRFAAPFIVNAQPGPKASDGYRRSPRKKYADGLHGVQSAKHGPDLAGRCSITCQRVCSCHRSCDAHGNKHHGPIHHSPLKGLAATESRTSPAPPEMSAKIIVGTRPHFIKRNETTGNAIKLTMPIPIIGSDAFCVAASEVRP